MIDQDKLDSHQFAREIARQLQKGLWDYVPNQDSWNAKITALLAQAELWIHVETGKARGSGRRVEISGGFGGELHRFAPYGSYGKHKITVTATKSIPRICQDIERRILPDYLTDLQIAKERHAAHVQRMQGVAMATLKFAAILNLPPPEVNDSEEANFSVSFRHVESVYGDIRIKSKDVQIKLDYIPFHVAAMMLVPLGEWIRQQPDVEDEPAEDVPDVE